MVDRFRVIEGGNQPKSHHKRGQYQQIECHVCLSDTQISTSLVTRAVQSPMRKENKITGGTQVFICLYCVMRGKITVLS